MGISASRLDFHLEGQLDDVVPLFDRGYARGHDPSDDFLFRHLEELGDPHHLSIIFFPEPHWSGIGQGLLFFHLGAY